MFLSMILSSVLFICILIFACRLFASHSFNIEGKVQDTILINRIYHQYTNAEIVRVNDQGSFVKETVWLDIPGVREDDYVFCYQDAGEPGRVMFSYDQGTLVIPFIFCIIFLIFFIVFWMMWRNIRGEKNKQKKEVYIIAWFIFLLTALLLVLLGILFWGNRGRQENNENAGPFIKEDKGEATVDNSLNQVSTKSSLSFEGETVTYQVPQGFESQGFYDSGS